MESVLEKFFNNLSFGHIPAWFFIIAIIAAIGFIIFAELYLRD